jgi:transposase-like protein
MPEQTQSQTEVRQRRTFSAAEKAAIMLRLVQDEVPLSKLADELKIQPAQLIAWRKQFFSNAALAFVKPEDKELAKAKSEIARLERRLGNIEAEKDQIIASVVAESCELKKKLSGPPSRPASGSSRI